MAHFLNPLLAETPALALRNERTGAIVASTLETAFGSADRRRGLLGRDSLAEGTALIIAPCNAVHTFFMRFPIDVVFAARDGRVVKVRARVRPWRLTAALGGFATIELPAGAAEHGDVRQGDVLRVSSGSEGGSRAADSAGQMIR
jgi:uncharacterized protein